MKSPACFFLERKSSQINFSRALFMIIVIHHKCPSNFWAYILETYSSVYYAESTLHYAEKYIGVRHSSFWFCMSAPIKKKTSHIFTQPGCETCRLKAKFDAPNVHSSLQLQFIFKESKFKIKYYLASTLSPHSV